MNFIWKDETIWNDRNGRAFTDCCRAKFSDEIGNVICEAVVHNSPCTYPTKLISNTEPKIVEARSFEVSVEIGGGGRNVQAIFFHKVN